MTTYFDFVPSNVAPFQFQPTLDDSTYNCVVTWNVFGRRYYVSCYDLSGNLQFSLPLIGSPGGLSLDSLSWLAGTATAVASDPHGYAIGETVELTIPDAAPAGYVGTYDALIVDPVSFTFPVASDPGPTVTPGTAFRNVDIAGGYFASTLVYRTPNQQFEVSP